MRFDWDDRKAGANRGKHGLTFEEAITAFDDPFALRTDDLTHSAGGEIRQWLVGETDEKEVIVVIFTERGAHPLIRLISARPATKTERRLYEEYKAIPI